MQYWWVNQNQTYEHEVRGGYLWSPKTSANGARNQFYENMKAVEPGDAIFSFCDTYIKAVGIATGTAVSSAKPDAFGTTGEYWGDEGWMVPVEFAELKKPIHPKSHIDRLRPTLPDRYAPLQPNGNGNQGVYLAAVPRAMAGVLRALLEGQFEAIVAASSQANGMETKDDEEERRIADRRDVPETEKLQLIKARRGQGLFRSRVELVERGCRLTGVSDRSHLRASHIKPWRDSADAEKLDGENGLLLAPHVDHLFDQGFISFSDDGFVLVSPLLPGSICQSWGLDFRRNIGSFSERQKHYLSFHRAQVFRSDEAKSPAAHRVSAGFFATP